MSQLTDNLNLIVSIKSDIKSAIENKGVDMTGVSFPDYASKIGEISGGGGVNPSGTLEISENGVYDVYSYASASVNVPQSVTGFTEKEITEGVQIVNLSNSASYVSPNVFANNRYIQTVNLPNCISVGDNAFANCSNLTTVSLPECKTIESSAFANCSSLQSIYLPNVEYISSQAFTNCSSLSNISLPNLKYISNSVFSNCINITYAYIPLVTTLIDSMFNNCIRLSSIYIEHCYYIRNSALFKTRITEINFPECYEVGKKAFGNCSLLQRVSLPNCYQIGNNWDPAFSNCSSLEELTLTMNHYVDFASNYSSFGLDKTKLASGIGSIYVQSWHYNKYITANGWSSLSERFVSVPVSSMLSFSNGLLSGYTNIIEYNFNSYIGIGYSEVIDVSLPNCEFIIPRPGWKPPQYVFKKECKNIQTLYLGSMSLCPAEFMNDHSNIRTLNLPICTSIGSAAFGGCISLSNISLPNVEYIGNNTFDLCKNLQSIDLPNVKYIGKNGFMRCYSLSEVSLPNVEYIGDSAFGHCSNITSINLPKCSILEGIPFYGADNLSVLTLGYGSLVSITSPLYVSGITSSTGSIYVPASLVDAYKSAPNWSYYSSVIFPIPE